MDNAAHIGGLITGAVMAGVMNSRLAERESLWVDRLLWGLTAVVMMALLWMIWGWSEEAAGCLGSVEAYRGCYPELVSEIIEARRSR